MPADPLSDRTNLGHRLISAVGYYTLPDTDAANPGET